ncbi:TetR/AcrR family transcriptional regulator [Roseateles sp.]|uniref:TetR/AcrR family transcriptional regulator n=1 Tax=Roseateles sp. TaxID=1971397 RepID=UPI0039EBA11F
MGRPSVRQQLVDAALEVFQTHGFNGASVQDLTDAAGVPKGSFYNHFTNKEELALEALKLYISQHGIEVLRDEKHEPLERIKRHFRANWKYVKDRGYRSGCFLGSLSSEISDSHETARVEFARYFHLWSTAIGRVIAEAQAAGTIDPSADPQALGRFVLNAWQGTLVRAKATKNEEAFKDFLAMIFGVVLAPKHKG